MEYVPGGSVGSCLRKYGRFDENVTKYFTEQILAGLEYLHSKGILHSVSGNGSEVFCITDFVCDNRISKLIISWLS